MIRLNRKSRTMSTSGYVNKGCVIHNTSLKAEICGTCPYHDCIKKESSCKHYQAEVKRLKEQV